MAGDPTATPVTTPETTSTVALDRSLLLQVPPPASFKVAVEPMQTLVVPVIPAGTGLTVNVSVVMQPVGNVYVIVAVPNATPVTTPAFTSTVAFDKSLLLHVPLAVASLSAMAALTHTLFGPVIAAGNGLTVIVALPDIISVQEEDA